jgi:predicted O-methyltransferase YrrM
MVPLRRGTFLYLVAYASAVKGDIVEVGSWQGRSTLFLAQACADTNNGVVHAIDTFQGSPSTGNRYPKGRVLEAGFRENIERAGLAEHVVLHPKRSADARAEIQGPLRMLFIDGEHTYEAVRADLAFVDLLAAGGVVAFDDYNPLFEGVVQAVQEFVAERKATRPVQVRNMLVTRLA